MHSLSTRRGNKADVQCAQYTYKKRKGKINKKKVCTVIACPQVDWDPDKWDGDIWDETDDEVDWDDLETGC